MAEEPYDTYIDFGFDDEATAFASPTDTQNLPPFLVEILAALNPGLPSLQVEEPAANASTFPSVPAAPSTSYAQSIFPFYHPFPTPSSSLGGALGNGHPVTCVRPSDTIHTHGASSAVPTPPAPSPYQPDPPTLPRLPRAKRPRQETEDSGRPEQSSPQKRRRATPPRTSAANVGHASSSINDHHPIPEVMDGAACREPVLTSMTWGILPGPESDHFAGPSTVGLENVPCGRISRKRTRNEESDGSATSNKRYKVALAEAPEVLNAPAATYSGLYSVDEHALAARFVGLPELSPEFYKELCDIASEIAQELKQRSGADGTSTYQDVPASSTATHPTGEDNNKPPSTTTKGKRLRPRAPPNQPPKKRQRTSSPTNANTLPPAVDTQPETPTKPFGCPFVTDSPPCLQRFTRQTDIKRHIRSKHLGCAVFCKNHDKPVRIVREDGVFRHLAFSTCKGPAARAELVAKRERETGGADKAGTRGWTAKVHRAVSHDYTLVRMPCYYGDARFWKALGHLPGWTPHRLEEWFRTYGKVERCECGRCEKIPDAELHGEVKIRILDQAGDAHPSPTATPVAGPSSAGAVARAVGPSGHLDVAAIASDAEWDDKLPPEEEEGVDEDLPQVSPPVADTVAQDNDAIATTHPPEDVGGVPPELQAVYNILSGLSDGDLEGILRGSDGSQCEVDPDGAADT